MQWTPQESSSIVKATDWVTLKLWTSLFSSAKSTIKKSAVHPYNNQLYKSSHRIQQCEYISTVLSTHIINATKEKSRKKEESNKTFVIRQKSMLSVRVQNLSSFWYLTQSAFWFDSAVLMPVCETCVSRRSCWRLNLYFSYLFYPL